MICRNLTTVCTFFLLFLFASVTPAVGAATTPEYLPGRIIVKLEDDRTFLKKWENSSENNAGKTDTPNSAGRYQDSPAEILQSRMQTYGVTEMNPVFRSGSASEVIRRKQTTADAPTRRHEELAKGFERTYFIRYTSSEDPAVLSDKVGRWPGVVYAEPHYVHQTTSYTPNDSLIGEAGHDYFGYMNFLEAWSVSRGSSDVVIAIIDTGVFYDHPDLRNKLWTNPVPGRANRLFGDWEIVNDTIGWNFWESGDVFNGEEPEQNADPVGNYSTHGTHVAGIAAADTDNHIGVAGTGFHAQYMPIKAGGTELYPNSIAYGFHGILYAAINRADVINCSFGSPNFSEFGQEAVEFATEEGSLVVAAAGNEGEDSEFFPAAYKQALSVGSVRRQYDNVISHFSNYGYFLDVFAMGEAVLSTFFDYDPDEVSWNPRYQRNTGTSMAAPIVSGLAALIKAENPEWSPQRIAMQIRTNGRSIIEDNPGQEYNDRLGTGLIDAHAALTNLNPGLRITEVTFQTEEGEKINIGESGTIHVSGINYGKTASGVTMAIQPLQTGIDINPESQSLATVPTNATFSMNFDVTLSRELPLDKIPVFRLDISDPRVDYKDFHMFTYEQLLYEILDVNRITASISSDGTIGFMDAFSSSGGIGFIPEGYDNILFEGGLMITADKQGSITDEIKPVIINQVRDSTGITRHFIPEDNLRFFKPGNHSDVDGMGVFKSSLHPSANEVTIKMETYAFDVSGTDKSFILKYEITNNSNATLSNMHVGMFNDWDIRDYDNDYTGFIEEDSLIYAYDPEGPPYVAVANMGAVSSAFAIDNTSPISLANATSREDSLRFGVYYREHEAHFDGFTDAEKRLALTAGTERTTVTGTDISIVTGTGPFTLMPMATIKVGFIYAWGESVDELRNQIAAAKHRASFETSTPGEYSRFREIADRLTVYQNFPNPFNNHTTIEFHLPEPGHAELAIYNLLGQRITTLLDDTVENRANYISFDASGLASGIYVAVLRSGGHVDTIKMSLIK